MGTISATGQEKFHKGFYPLLPGFVFAEFNNLDSVKALINKKTAAIMVEPVQGEGGVNVGTAAFLKGLRQLADKHNLTLIFDEVQTGLGRTGTFFAYEKTGVRPDVVTLAKSLGGGLPIGATIVSTKCENALGIGDHASTFGGNPVSCAAAMAVLSLLDKKSLKHVRQVGAYFQNKLTKLKNKYSFIKAVRGTGLMIGLELNFSGASIVDFCRQQGVLINCTHDTVLRFLPPLTVNAVDVDCVVKLLDKALTMHK
jgi:acetylornithine/succinyldiaminopimelate/putrescine aminotransferase